MNIVVLGSGGWGTALAIELQKSGHAVTLWSHDLEKAEMLSLTRENALLKGVQISPEIFVTNALSCLQKAQLVVFAAPSFALRSVARQAAALLPAGVPLLSVTKGIEKGTHLRMSEILSQETQDKNPVAVLSGPSHAEEVARGVPTGCVLAAGERALALKLQGVIMSERFRIYTHDDVVGVELAGALKNVVALCCGVSDGLGLGDNSKALLMTRAMAEMSRLAESLGGRKETFAGLAGMGDLIVTCTSMHSRNRRAGILLGQGKTPQQALEAVGAVVEGYFAAESAHELAAAQGVEMPICGAMYNVLYHGTDVRGVIRSLMDRPPRGETDDTWV